MAPKTQLKTYMEPQSMWPLAPSLPLPQTAIIWNLLLLTAEAGTTYLAHQPGLAFVPSSDLCRLTTYSSPLTCQYPVGWVGLSQVCLDRGYLSFILYCYF